MEISYEGGYSLPARDRDGRARAVAHGRLKGGESLLAQATIRVEGLNLTLYGEDDVKLE